MQKRKFSWRSLGANKFPSILIIGGRRKGKTTLITDLLKQTRRYDRHPCVVVFTKNHENMKYYRGLGCIVIYGYKKEVLNCLTEDYAELKKIVIFDDCIDKTEIKHSPEISELFTMGRHNRYTVIFSTQDSMMTGTSWRKNLDLLFIFSVNYGMEREFIVNNYLYGLPGISKMTKNELLRLLENLPKYYCITVDHMKEPVETYLFKARLYCPSGAHVPLDGVHPPKEIAPSKDDISHKDPSDVP